MGKILGSNKGGALVKNQINDKEYEKCSEDGIDDDDYNDMIGGKIDGVGSSSICENILRANKSIRSQEVNGETATCSDDSEEGDEIDGESLCDSFYSGKSTFLC